MSRYSLLSLLVFLGLIPASVGAQTCGFESGPDYAHFTDALRNLDIRLDTLSIVGTRDVTLVSPRPGGPWSAALGTPSPSMRDSAAGHCRVAGLWSSRGDSVAVHWIVAPQAEEILAWEYAGDSLALADRPRPAGYTTAALIQFPQAMRAMIAESRARAAGDVGLGTTMVLVLIDERGRPVITRLASGSGRRELDEVALSALMLAFSTPSDSTGVSVSRWYAAPVGWRD